MKKKIGILLMIISLLLTSAFDLIYIPEENNDPEITYTDFNTGEIPSDTGYGEGWIPEDTAPVFIEEVRHPILLRIRPLRNPRHPILLRIRPLRNPRRPTLLRIRPLQNPRHPPGRTSMKTRSISFLRFILR